MVFRGPLFVVGAPRSGTKLLRDLLRRHPEIGIPGHETEFLPSLWEQDFDFEGDFAGFYRWVRRSLYFRSMEREGRCISIEQWQKAAPTLDVRGVFEGLCRHDAEQPGGIWGDKSPSYRNYLPELAELYPEARFVHIVRDARDVCLSSYRVWGKNILRNAQRWYDEVGDCRRAGRALGSSYLEVRYEDLLADPEGCMGAAARHCDLDFDPRMLSPGRQTENHGAARGATEIVAGNTDKWREQMDAKMLRGVEELCGPLLAELGYELAHPGIAQCRAGSGRMLAWRLQDGANLLRFRIKEWGWQDAVKYSLSSLETSRRNERS
jgi:hypothetical protein